VNRVRVDLDRKPTTAVAVQQGRRIKREATLFQRDRQIDAGRVTLSDGVVRLWAEAL